ncbi:M15 family metallopeptidase [Actinomadura welshii]
MVGRHRKKNIEPAPVLSVVLAAFFAGAVALAPLDGGSGDPGGPDPAVLAADRSEQSASQRAESAADEDDEPSRPPSDCKPSEDTEHGYPNGRIPTDELCDLPGEGEHLRADAALAFYELNEAYHERFGDEVCVRSSYRSYEKQAELYESMPSGMAARPGNSKHGNGIALDLCGGVEDGDSPQFRWMEDNAEKYGWIHPDWAYSNPYEPWHWEFEGD